MVGVEVGDDHLNDTSVALRALFGSSAVLMAGDMEVDAEMGVLASGADVRAQVLKVGHHGSRTSTSTGFLLAVDPEVAIISAGRQNSFGHPHLSTLRRLEHFGVQILRTAEEGTITIRCSRERCR
jgi:beta-lactamase superfamily II metal-dependent hydrolase